MRAARPTQPQNVLACRWGTTAFEDEEVDRPEFVGEDLWDWESSGRKRRYFADENKFAGDDPEIYTRGFVKGNGAKVSACAAMIGVETSARAVVSQSRCCSLVVVPSPGFLTLSLA